MRTKFRQAFGEVFWSALSGAVLGAVILYIASLEIWRDNAHGTTLELAHLKYFMAAGAVLWTLISQVDRAVKRKSKSAHARK